MYDHRLAPVEGAPLSLAALALNFDSVAGALLIGAIAIGLAAIGAWLRSELRSEAPPAAPGGPPPAEPARPRPVLVPSAPDERERPPVIGYVLLEGNDLAAAGRAIGVW